MNQDIYIVIEQIRGQVMDISYVMLAVAQSLAQKTGGKSVALLLGSNSKELARNFKVGQVIYVDHPALAEFTPDAYLPVLAELIREKEPRAVLFGNTSIGSDIASVLSAKLGLPLVSSCQKVSDEGKLICQICGGKIMVETPLAETTTLVTVLPGGYKPEEGQDQVSPEIVTFNTPDLSGMRVLLKDYIEPEAGDVDISKEPILVSVGRAIQNADNIELVQELADAIGGVLCASRPVIDQGWLPTTRLVGKSGKKVKPKLYLAIGISGAPEHTEGMADSELIVAVNTDPTAPIFNFARYGTTLDLFELLPVLSERVRTARSG